MKRSLVLVTLAALGAAACEDETIIPLVETLELRARSHFALRAVTEKLETRTGSGRIGAPR